MKEKAMEKNLRLFSWVAFGAIGRDGVDRLGESQCSEIMQNAWNKTLHTLRIAFEGGYDLPSDQRRQLAENFAKKFTVPFAIKNRLTSPNIEGFVARALQQCRDIIEKGPEVIDFRSCGKAPHFHAPAIANGGIVSFSPYWYNNSIYTFCKYRAKNAQVF